MEVLQAEPPLTERGGAEQMLIVADADPADASAVPRRDLAVSFNPEHREFGFRPVREWRMPKPEMPEQTEHDAMAELR